MKKKLPSKYKIRKINNFVYALDSPWGKKLTTYHSSEHKATQYAYSEWGYFFKIGLAKND